MKKIIIPIIAILLLGGMFWYLQKNNFSVFGIKLLPTKSGGVEKIHSVGIIMTGGAYQQAVDGLKKGLEEKGFFEGKNITYIIKDTRGNTDALKPATEELLKEKPDVIYSISTPVTTQVSKIVGSQIPIIFNIVGDPIGAGFSKSYSQPQTNLTGCSNRSAELSGKRLEIFQEAFPSLKKVITFFDPSNAFSNISIEKTRETAKILQIELSEVQVKNKDDLSQALATIQPGQYDGIYITPDAMVVSNVDQIITASQALKIPTMGHEETLAQKGVSLTYGANFYRLGAMCASVFTDLFSGQSPQNIPIRTPDKLDIVLNKKSLDAIGAAASQDILNLADLTIR